MAYLTLTNINKIYPNGFHAVHNFNLEIEQGEFIVFVGPSGCGKSTTLRMVAGLEDISSGDFLIDGRRVNELGPREREVAMVFQSYALYPQMSVFDNLGFGLTLQGVDEDVIEERVLATAKILGLTDYLDRMPRALSGGQRQRVAVGRAIIRKVGVFLMDEPLSNLDAKQRVTMRSEITQIHRNTHATTIYVTHDQTEAMTMADRIVVMKQGYVQQVGTPYELYFKPANLFVAGFIGEPPMNFIRGTVKDKKFAIDTQSVDLSLCMGDRCAGCENREIVFGFRPEAIQLGEREGAYHLKAQVELTEMLGDNANVYITMGEEHAILKVDPHDIPPVDSGITFSVPYDRVYLFDAQTEEVIDTGADHAPVKVQAGKQ
ncbi:MAG: sn-glycerol-3-phosphate ABC transporter ATP-binding protein UgpC [Lachnospiraceae bacterium]|nr:sn-glycerol-3-phosphate ABC transporter ATP-binding protein UgpC [Lachnospiraceae bacterium]